MGLSKLHRLDCTRPLHTYICKCVDGGSEAHFLETAWQKTAIPIAAHFQPKQFAPLFFKSAFLSAWWLDVKVSFTHNDCYWVFAILRWEALLRRGYNCSGAFSKLGAVLKCLQRFHGVPLSATARLAISMPARPSMSSHLKVVISERKQHFCKPTFKQ